MKKKKMREDKVCDKQLIRVLCRVKGMGREDIQKGKSENLTKFRRERNTQIQCRIGGKTSTPKRILVIL